MISRNADGEETMPSESHPDDERDADGMIGLKNQEFGQKLERDREYKRLMSGDKEKKR